jgi:hypothetical protein
MAVLIEAISVVLSVSAIQNKFPGGWDKFKESIRNQTLCCDNEVARVGFMDPSDVENFIESVCSEHLTFIKNERSIDLAVFDQQRGLTTECDWLEVGKISWEGDPSKRITVARLKGSQFNQIMTPKDWDYEGSLSHTFGFSPTAADKRGLIFLRHEKGLDVYLNELNGKEVYVGRNS